MGEREDATSDVYYVADCKRPRECVQLRGRALHLRGVVMVGLGLSTGGIGIWRRWTENRSGHWTSYILCSIVSGVSRKKRSIISMRSLGWDSEVVGVDQRRVLPQLPAGPRRYSTARGRPDDPVWRSRLCVDLGECSA